MVAFTDADSLAVAVAAVAFTDADSHAVADAELVRVRCGLGMQWLRLLLRELLRLL